ASSSCLPPGTGPPHLPPARYAPGGKSVQAADRASGRIGGSMSTSMEGSPGADLVRTMPKAEIHVHLEGCFELDDVVALARQAGVTLPDPPERLFDVRDLGSFLELLDLACSLVRTPEQLARAAYRFAEREAASRVVYADLIVNPI